MCRDVTSRLGSMLVAAAQVEHPDVPLVRRAHGVDLPVARTEENRGEEGALRRLQEEAGSLGAEIAEEDLPFLEIEELPGVVEPAGDDARVRQTRVSIRGEVVDHHAR